MNIICKITDNDIGENYIEINNPKTRLGARGIVIRDDGKIAIFNKFELNLLLGGNHLCLCILLIFSPFPHSLSDLIMNLTQMTGRKILLLFFLIFQKMCIETKYKISSCNWDIQKEKKKWIYYFSQKLWLLYMPKLEFLSFGMLLTF